MAAPTPVTYERQVGHSLTSLWEAEWATTDNFTDTIIIDLSGMAEEYTSGIKIEKLFLISTTGIEIVLEFDATTDQLVAVLPEGATGPINLDFRDLPDGGLRKTAAGGTADLVLTTTGAASGDRVYLSVLSRLE
jgi:hypothetical protein